MQFQNLSKLYETFPKELVEQMDEYLFEVKDRPPGYQEIVPSLMAKKLKIKEEKALIMLYMADKAGIVNPKFQVYWPDDRTFLGIFESINDIPLYFPPPNGHSGEAIDRNELLVDLVFSFLK